jgi:hypothetical protein
MCPSPRYQPSSSAYASWSSSAPSQRGHGVPGKPAWRCRPSRWCSRRQRRMVLMATPWISAFTRSPTPLPTSAGPSQPSPASGNEACLHPDGEHRHIIPGSVDHWICQKSRKIRRWLHSALQSEEHQAAVRHGARVAHRVTRWAKISRGKPWYSNGRERALKLRTVWVRIPPRAPERLFFVGRRGEPRLVYDDEVRAAIATDESLNSISKRLGISRSTPRDWRDHPDTKLALQTAHDAHPGRFLRGAVQLRRLQVRQLGHSPGRGTAEALRVSGTCSRTSPPT